MGIFETMENIIYAGKNLSKKPKEIKILFVFLKHKIIISEVILITTDSDNGKWEVPRVKINWFKTLEVRNFKLP